MDSGAQRKGKREITFYRETVFLF